MAEKTAYYVKIAVEGIQKYICATSKLKEMIGGSEIINLIAEFDFYNPLLAPLTETDNPRQLERHYLVAQANAGALCLVLPDETSARTFLQKASRELLSHYPGLPFFTAMLPFRLDDGRGECESYRDARKKADELIKNERNTTPPPLGCGLLPILIAARLDGLPTAGFDKLSTTRFKEKERLSLPSLARSANYLINKSAKRLQDLVKNTAPITLQWKADLNEMLPGEDARVALICMDGNDLGKLFGTYLKESNAKNLQERIKEMRDLSDLIKKANEDAFAYACKLLVQYEEATGKVKNGELIMPLRPLVMGGDDLTIIARADIALYFTAAFVRKFEEIGKAQHLSLGIGMVIMNASYPFAKAFPLAESLQDSAKMLTSRLPREIRPSSIDYLLLTEDMENSEEQVRQRIFLSASGDRLTGKPFILSGKPKPENCISLRQILEDGIEVNEKLARSQIREAWSLCRNGPLATQTHWRNLKENVHRKLGGRNGKDMETGKFEEIFSDNYFIPVAGSTANEYYTLLGDYLELEKLLPTTEKRQILEKIFPLF